MNSRMQTLFRIGGIARVPKEFDEFDEPLVNDDFAMRGDSGHSPA